MKAFLTPLQGLAEFEQIKEKSKTNKGILQVSGCMESQKSHLMYGLSGIAPYRLILAEDERRAREIYEDYRFYDRKRACPSFEARPLNFGIFCSCLFFKTPAKFLFQLFYLLL